MSGSPMTDSRPDDVLAELIAREPIFHRLELGTSRADFEAQTAPDFFEVGASGAIYDRETVWSRARGALRGTGVRGERPVGDQRVRLPRGSRRTRTC